MAHLTTQDVNLSLLSPTYGAADISGDTFDAGDRTFLHLRNGSAGSVTAIVNDPNSVEPSGATTFDPDVTITVEPGGSRVAGPFPASRFADPDDGYVHVSYDDVTDTDVAIMRLSTPGLA